MKFKPKMRQLYYFITIGNIDPLFKVNSIESIEWVGDTFDQDNYKIGNCFKKRKEALIVYRQIKKLMKTKMG